MTRIRTIPEAFINTGSVNSRLQLAKEAIGLIYQSPIFGVGLNRFQEIGVVYSSTRIFDINGLTAFTKSHNMFLEMSAELGLPGMMFFLVFIVLITKILIKKIKKNPYAKSLLFSWISLILISQFHPFLLTSQFRLFYLLSAIVLVL